MTIHRIIKNDSIVDNPWRIIANDESLENKPNETNLIVPLSVWQDTEALQQRDDIGVWIDNDIELEAFAESIIKAPIIAINFPAFMDGRGFSLARLLRERYRYQGEIRTIGHIIRDQLCYLKRCGFNAFSFSDESVDLEASLNSLNDLTEAYQTSVDKPMPLFRRRA